MLHVLAGPSSTYVSDLWSFTDVNGRLPARRCLCLSTACRIGNASLHGMPQLLWLSLNFPEFTANSSCFCWSHGLLSSSGSHCVIAYAHPVRDASVNMHARFLRSLYDVYIVCSSASRMVARADRCFCPHPVSDSFILLAAFMFLRLADLRAPVRNADSTDAASEKSGMSSRIHPVDASNCHTSPTVFGSGMFRSPATRSGSTVIPLRVTLNPQYIVLSTNSSHFLGCMDMLWDETVCKNSSSISSISSSLCGSFRPFVVYSSTSSVCTINPFPNSGRPSRRFTFANM